MVRPLLQYPGLQAGTSSLATQQCFCHGRSASGELWTELLRRSSLPLHALSEVFAAHEHAYSDDDDDLVSCQ